LFFSNLKNNPKAAGLPQFKKKHSNISLKYKPFKPEHFIVNDKNIRIKFPIIGWVKARGKWDLEGGKVKTVAVTQECGEYFATLSVEVPQKKIIHPNKDQIVGIDMGVITTATLSDGTSFKLPDSVKDLDKRVRALQRRMRNKKKHSKNSKKAYAKIAKVQKRIARQKQSFFHEQSTRIAKQYGGIIVEDLKIQNMTKSAKGTKEKPGKNVAQKKGLNREILRNSLGDLKVKLEQKSKKFGGVFVKIDPKYTSQKCSKCGKQGKENRQTQASFVCTACGFSANADFNAALNIKEAGKFIVRQQQNGIKT
jgi:putative transposase